MSRDTKQIGETSESRVLYELKKRGYTVLQPFGDNAKYDLVYDDDGDLTRVQVKTGRLRNGVVQFHTTTAGHNNTSGTYHKEYTEDDIDEFMVYCQETDEVYVCSVDEVGSSMMSIRVAEPKDFVRENMNMREDFLLTERLK